MWICRHQVTHRFSTSQRWEVEPHLPLAQLCDPSPNPETTHQSEPRPGDGFPSSRHRLFVLSFDQLGVAQQRLWEIAEWVRLTGEVISSQVEKEIKVGKGRPKGGINAASRELGVDKNEAYRSEKIASIKPEAKAQVEPLPHARMPTRACPRLAHAMLRERCDGWRLRIADFRLLPGRSG